jgi:dihydroorotate dehydrogenase
MSLVSYGLTRKFLFSLSAEAAHSVTMAGLALAQRTPLQLAYCSPRVHDPIELAGLRFPNRVGLAAGLDKNARCIDGLGAMGFGFVEVGTVTPKAQAGNPKPRMFRLPAANALINRLGFNNDGLEAFVANVSRSSLRLQKNPDLLLGLNIGKNKDTPNERATEDYLACLDAVYPYADYITINISSPNTKNLRDLQNFEALDALLNALSTRRAHLAIQGTAPDSKGRMVPRHVPLFLKIAPDLDNDQIKAIVVSLLRHGMDGVVATNTTVSREAVRGLPHAKEAGGLSGAPVLEMSNRVISQLRAALGPRFPIIGVGGIMSGEDAVSKIKAGADVVQIYTGLIYQGPQLVREAALAIKNMKGKQRNPSWTERK